MSVEGINKPKIIQIPTTREEIFKQYLYIINGVLSDEKKLTTIEIDVLEKMLLIDYIYKHHPKDKRDKILFNKITKDKIRSEVYNISGASFNNILMKLRRKGFITKDSLKVVVPISDGKIDLTFKLEIK
jgi:hypothetical protein